LTRVGSSNWIHEAPAAFSSAITSLQTTPHQLATEDLGATVAINPFLYLLVDRKDAAKKGKRRE
jgi:hypothetical protein